MTNFSQMYEQYVEPVYYFLRELSGDDRLAQKLTHKTFCHAFLHVDSFENQGSVFDWLCQIGRDMYLKKRKETSGLYAEEKISKAGQFKTNVPAAEREKRIRRGLRKIRRRWICSVAATAAVILLILMGVFLAAGSSLTVPEFAEVLGK